MKRPTKVLMQMHRWRMRHLLSAALLTQFGAITPVFGRPMDASKPATDSKEKRCVSEEALKIVEGWSPAQRTSD